MNYPCFASGNSIRGPKRLQLAIREHHHRVVRARCDRGDCLAHERLDRRRHKALLLIAVAKEAKGEGKLRDLIFQGNTWEVE